MKATLLVIADDVSLRWNLTGRLREEGYKIIEAGQEEIRKILRAKHVDVVLLSLLDEFKAQGLALIQTIKKAKPFTEVIILNRSNQLSLSMEVMKLGAFDDILYPFDLTLLVQRIEEAYASKNNRQKTRKPLLRGYEKAMAAASFAEAGEAEMAREILGVKKKQRRDKNDQKIELGREIELKRLVLKTTET